MNRLISLVPLCLLAVSAPAREVTWEGVLLNQTNWTGEFPAGAPFSLTVEFDTAEFSGTIANSIGSATFSVTGGITVSGEALNGGRILFNIAAGLNEPSVTFDFSITPPAPLKPVSFRVELYRDLGDGPVDFSLEQPFDLSAFRLIEVVVEMRSPEDTRSLEAGFGWVVEGPVDPVGQPDPVRKDGYKALFGFGDSLSETSLDFTMDEDGRFFTEEATNGPVWLQYLAWMLDIPFREALNFSQFGGFDLPERGVFLPLPRSESLGVSWVNSELLNGVITIAFSDGSEESQAASDAIAILTERVFLKTAELVYTLEIPDYLVLGVADIGFAPGIRGFLPLSEQKEVLTGFVEATNSIREVYIETWFAILFPGMRVSYYDPNGHLREIQAQPASFGFTNMTDSVKGDESGGSPLEDLSITGPGSSHFFWESLSPTTRVHRILADRVYADTFSDGNPPETSLIMKSVRLTNSQIWLFNQHPPQGAHVQLLQSQGPQLAPSRILAEVTEIRDPSLFFIAPLQEDSNDFFGLISP
jgi:hypothetical protein